MTTKIEVEVVNDNPFNKGWLGYLLGLPEPSVEDSPDEHDGWVMGRETLSLKPVRQVFTRQHDLDDPQYVVNVNVTVNDQNVVNVGGKVRIVVTDE